MSSFRDRTWPTEVGACDIVPHAALSVCLLCRCETAFSCRWTVEFQLDLRLGSGGHRSGSRQGTNHSLEPLPKSCSGGLVCRAALFGSRDKWLGALRTANRASDMLLLNLADGIALRTANLDRHGARLLTSESVRKGDRAHLPERQKHLTNDVAAGSIVGLAAYGFPPLIIRCGAAGAAHDRG